MTRLSAFLFCTVLITISERLFWGERRGMRTPEAAPAEAQPDEPMAVSHQRH